MPANLYKMMNLRTCLLQKNIINRMCCEKTSLDLKRTYFVMWIELTNEYHYRVSNMTLHKDFEDIVGTYIKMLLSTTCSPNRAYSSLLPGIK